MEFKKKLEEISKFFINFLFQNNVEQNMSKISFNVTVLFGNTQHRL